VFFSSFLAAFEVTIDLELNPKKLDRAFIERLHDRMDQDPQFDAAADVTQKVRRRHTDVTSTPLESIQLSTPAGCVLCRTVGISPHSFCAGLA
jgi:hypothetical protein